MPRSLRLVGTVGAECAMAAAWAAAVEMLGDVVGKLVEQPQKTWYSWAAEVACALPAISCSPSGNGWVLFLPLDR